ncbi:MAG: hypothetical protein JWM89_932 [Acidimicrobiales bacterium]|nr:hypothetical protein [Acidimicrobiales bacterium]
MRKYGATSTKWIGRLLLLAVPYILVCGFFAPRGVQFLNEPICDPGQHLDNRGAVPSDANPDTTNSIELTCKSDQLIVNATGRILTVCAVLVAASLGFFLTSNRMTVRRISGPQVHHT